MKPLIVYCSRTGNTRRVVEVMARSMEADAAAVEEVTAAQVEGRRLIGLASGIYWYYHDRKIYDLIPRLPREAKVFTLTTSGIKNKWFVGRYQAHFQRRLGRLGLDLVGQWHCPGFDQHPLFKWMRTSHGRPDEDDLARASDFSRRMLRHVGVA